MNEITQWNQYVARFDTNDPKIQLKIKHTMKVCTMMDMLSTSLELDAQDRKIAHTIALYHDIGRFEQLKQFGTFLDHKSVDHADLGVSILQESQFLEEYSQGEKEQILFAIANHNKYHIEYVDDQKKLLFAKMIRDADKCDIFRVFACEDPQTVSSVTLEIRLPHPTGFSRWGKVAKKWIFMLCLRHMNMGIKKRAQISFTVSHYFRMQI